MIRVHILLSGDRRIEPLIDTGVAVMIIMTTGISH
jgi:hypothetical protein